MDVWNNSLNKFGKNYNLSYFLVPETMSLLYVRSNLCIAPFHVWSQICIAPMHVRFKFVNFALQMDGSNADYATLMKGSYADFAPHIEQRHSFSDQKIAQIVVCATF